MTAPTPGPWKVVDSSMGRASRVVDTDDLIIADCWNSNQEANARLIASAPQLLAALQIAESLLSARLIIEAAKKEGLTIIRQALAAAEGKAHA